MTIMMMVSVFDAKKSAEIERENEMSSKYETVHDVCVFAYIV